MTTEQKLAALHNRATRYELAAVNGDRRILVAYTSRQGRMGILKACQGRADAMIALCCPTGADCIAVPMNGSPRFLSWGSDALLILILQCRPVLMCPLWRLRWVGP